MSDDLEVISEYGAEQVIFTTEGETDPDVEIQLQNGVVYAPPGPGGWKTFIGVVLRDPGLWEGATVSSTSLTLRVWWDDPGDGGSYISASEPEFELRGYWSASMVESRTHEDGEVATFESPGMYSPSRIFINTTYDPVYLIENFTSDLSDWAFRLECGYADTFEPPHLELESLVLTGENLPVEVDSCCWTSFIRTRETC